MRAAPIAIVLSTAGCGGPALSQLVADKHYREAICAAESPSSRDEVAHALDADAQIYVHVHVVSPDELREVLGDATDDVAGRATFVRVRAQGNALPVDRLSLAVALTGGGGAAKPVEWTSLAWATREHLPPQHPEETYLTGGNVLRGLAAVVTAGVYLIFDPFKPGTQMVDAPREEYERVAPHATALHDAMPPAACSDERLAGNGQSCEGFFVVDARGTAPLALEVKTTYEADRLEGPPADGGAPPTSHEDACAIETRAAIALGTPGEMAERAERTFGSRGRALAEVAR